MTTRTSSVPVVLVDGSSYLYRAFHALPPLTTSTGQPTGAIHGVLNMLQRLRKDYQPTHMAVVFDAKGKTFRDDLYKEYKANRPPMPDDLRLQIEPLHQTIKAMGFPLIQIPGVEADDVIGTLAQDAAKAGRSCLISTGDKDLAQLVTDDITLINTMNNQVFDIEGVQNKFGVMPGQIIDYLGLVGDTSDNIPGVPKVGPKTASKWLNEYGTVDSLIEHQNDIKGKVGESLRDNIESLLLSKKLATIVCDLSLELDLEDLRTQGADGQALQILFSQLELTQLAKQFSSDIPTSSKPDTPADYQTIFSEKELETWVDKISKSDYMAFDTETTSLNYMEAEIVGVSFAVEENSAAYVPFAHDYPGAPDQIDRDSGLALLKPLLENPEIKKVGHHLKYDAHVLANHDIQLNGVAFDSMLESYILNSTACRHDMDSAAKLYLDVETKRFEDVAGKGVKQLTFNEVPIESASPYAAEDADVTLQLHNAIWKRLSNQPKLKKLYQDIEQPLVEVLFSMEHYGVLVDTDMLAKQSKEINIQLIELEKQAHEFAGGPFNLGSPKQLQEILFERLEIPVLRKTPKGQPSTAEDVLQELAEDYDLPRVILEHRSLSKLKSTYTDKLPEQVNPKTKRIHTSYHQAVAATGRLSSSDPNLQNIPIRTSEGRRIRQAFVAPPDHKILACDYSQIELRIMAHLSEDPGLLSAFSAGADIHRATASEVFGVELDQVSGEQRRSAKAINFGLIYGMSAFGLGKQLGISRTSAQEYVDLYFARYPGVQEYMNRTREEAREQGFVETVFGRRLYLPEIKSRNYQRRQYAERSAINAPMQGTAADIIKLAMLRVFDWLQDKDIRLIMQVHDELVFEVPTGIADETATEVSALMADAAELRVPLKVDAGVGENWDEAH
ncbi:MAG: DNA polymerase I [Pseudomonadota bacterium]